MYYAHIRKDGEKQSVISHLVGTAQKCAEFAAVFYAEGQGYLTGIMHDIGKYSDAFQRRILNQGPIVDHSTAGAYQCIIHHQPYAAFCIAGHHGGIPDGGGKTDSADIGTLFGRMNRAKKNDIPNYELWNDELQFPDVQLPNSVFDQRGQDFFVRMLFSCLTDADYLDTEQFMSADSVARVTGKTVTPLVERIDEYTAKWFPPLNELNRQRCKILTQCINQGDNESLQPGFFTLSVPTGGGKTVASLAFALHHAKTHGKSRIIYVVPYTSIIEQTADVFRNILGDCNILEHHSGVTYDFDEEERDMNNIMHLATENWDMPVVVTTAVQFFESIYSNRPSKCRKLHNLANSVIVFDEAQMLPIGNLRPCVSAMSQLVENYGDSVVLCTATQPALDGLIHEFSPNANITEICPRSIYNSKVFQRVMIENRGKVSLETIAREICKCNQVLCIVNTKKCARELYTMLGNAEGKYHLSTFMVPAHRRKCLNEIRNRLKLGQPCCVVSTSLIEAGVDVDFPIVFREIAGLDSAIQAAGRCNREGTRSAKNSKVVIFQTSSAAPPLLERNIDVGKMALAKYSDITSEEAVSFYFKELLDLSGEKAQDKSQILQRIQNGSFPFASIAKEFHMIDRETVTIYIPWKDGKKIIDRLINGERGRTLFREASQYSVAVYYDDLKHLVDFCMVEEIEKDVWVLSDIQQYSDEIGLLISNNVDGALFI